MSESLLAFQFFQRNDVPSKEGKVLLEKASDVSDVHDSFSGEPSSEEVQKTFLDEYSQLQLRLNLAILIITAFAVIISALFFDIQVATSLLVGSISGVLYLRLLARSIGRFGKFSKNVSKVQLLVPVLLVLAASKLPQLELIPALLGFFLYKPSMILQGLLES